MEKIIKSVADLSIEELDRLENEEKINRIIISKRPNIPEDVPTKLSVKEYRRIYNALICITSGIKEEWSPTKKFVLIYKRLAESIFYDYIAAYPKDEEQEKYSDREFENCRNLKNGLLLRRCVCTGYAEILRNACLLKGVNAIVIHGLTSDGELHAWNQVEIDDGKWIEVDLTWDSSNRTLTKYMGKDKNKFWEKHRRINYSVSKIIFCEENMVSNFDLTAFINEQFGLNCRYFSIEEQDEFIRILDRRDTQSLDISKPLNSLIFKINQRMDFEKECGYTIDELIEIGFLKKEIEQLVKNRFDEKTGGILDRKKIVENQINRLLKKQEDFEEECGYTIDELVRMGFEKEEIELLKRNKFDGETGKRLDRKRIIEDAVNVVLKKQEGVKRSYRYLIDKVTPIKMITEEEQKELSIQAQDLHSDILTGLLNGIEEEYISFEEALSIINYKKEFRSNSNTRKDNINEDLSNNTDGNKSEDLSGNARGITNDDEINEIIYKVRIIKEMKSFEKECGYTMDELVEMGFSLEELKQMVKKFDEKTGERIDRKKVVDEAIERRKNIGFQENSDER